MAENGLVLSGMKLMEIKSTRPKCRGREPDAVYIPDGARLVISLALRRLDRTPSGIDNLADAPAHGKAVRRGSWFPDPGAAQARGVP